MLTKDVGVTEKFFVTGRIGKKSKKLKKSAFFSMFSDVLQVEVYKYSILTNERNILPGNYTIIPSAEDTEKL